MDTLLSQLWSPLEATAVVLAVLYLVLLIRENILAWVCGGLSSAIYVYIMIDARLYMESVLYFIYFAMAIYGYAVWYGGRTDDHELPVSTWRLATHGKAITIIVALSGASGYLLHTHTDAAYPYIDSLTT